MCRINAGGPIYFADATRLEHECARTIPFNEVVEAADRLSPEEQFELVGILQRRLAEAGRRRVVAEVQQSRREFATGKCAAASADEVMQEILK